MDTKFQVIALSSLDPEGRDRKDEPRLSYPDALKTAQELKVQGKASRVYSDDEASDAEERAFTDLGAVKWAGL